MTARPESLAELVAQRIATLGVSQVDYAIRMGVERSVLHNVLSGKSLLPKEPFRRKLASDLGITVLDIFVLAGELQPDDIRVVTDARSSGPSEAMCALVRQVDWERRPDQYDDLTHQLSRWVARDAAPQAAPQPPAPASQPAD